MHGDCIFVLSELEATDPPKSLCLPVCACVLLTQHSWKIELESAERGKRDSKKHTEPATHGHIDGESRDTLLYARVRQEVSLCVVGARRKPEAWPVQPSLTLALEARLARLSISFFLIIIILLEPIRTTLQRNLIGLIELVSCPVSQHDPVALHPING